MWAKAGSGEVLMEQKGQGGWGIACDGEVVGDVREQ